MWDACFVHSFFVLWLVVFHLVIGSQFGHDLPKANLNANSASHEFIFESHGGRLFVKLSIGITQKLLLCFSERNSEQAREQLGY